MMNPSALLEWINAGILVQITGSSLSGNYGKAIRRFSLKMLRHRMVHLVASDAHGSVSRRPALSKARKITEAVVGQEDAHRIFYEYPAQLLGGDPPDVAPPLPLDKKRNLIRRLFPFW